MVIKYSRSTFNYLYAVIFIALVCLSTFDSILIKSMAVIVMGVTFFLLLYLKYKK